MKYLQTLPKFLHFAMCESTGCPYSNFREKSKVTCFLYHIGQIIFELQCLYFAVYIQIHDVLLACLSILQSGNHAWKIKNKSLEKELKASKAKSQELTTKVEELNVS